MTTEEDKWLDAHGWSNKSRLYRYFAMLNLIIIGIGLFVSYDSLGALQEAIMGQMDMSAKEFSAIYSAGSFPAIVLCFFGGFLIDRLFGIRLGTFLYSCLFTLGHFIFALGVLLSTYWLILIGRLIFGIGFELVLVCMQYYTVIYFKGKELSLVLCTTLVMSRLGSSVVYELAAPLSDLVRPKGTGHQPGNDQPGLVLFIVGSFGVVAVLCSVVLGRMRPRREALDSCSENDDSIRFKDVSKFGISYWLSIVSCSCMILNHYLLIPFSQAFFMTVHGLDLEAANKVSSFFSLVGVGVAPLAGLLVDRIGREVFLVVLGFLLGTTSHLVLALSTFTPYFSMLLLSSSMSLLTATLFPLIAYIVPQKFLGTAYGINQAMINLAFSVMILVAGVIVDKFGYEALELFSAANVFVGLISSLLLWAHNSRTGGSLNWSATRRKQQLDKELKRNEAAQPLKC